MAFLSGGGILIFDYQRFAEPLRGAIRAQGLAASAAIELIHKEDIVARVLQRHGEQRGLVHVISAIETCRSYKPWHNKVRLKIPAHLKMAAPIPPTG